MFSKACEYGIKATLYIAQQSLKNERVSLKTIAREIDGPEAFVAKILQQLARKNYISSTKGPSGGFEMDRRMIEETKLIDVVETFDGDDIFTRCGLGLSECSETHPCPVHDKFKIVRSELSDLLRSTSILDSAMGLEDKSLYLKR